MANKKEKKSDRLTLTGQECFDLIQKSIQANSVEVEEERIHMVTVSRLVVDDITKSISDTAPKGRYDENMWLLSNVGFHLVNWYLKIQRAKAMDPMRPIKGRKRAYKRLIEYKKRIMSAIADDADDHEWLPGQRWDNPNTEQAVDGQYK